MWGHVIKDVNPLFNWVCTFHVPVFLVLSGLLFAYRNKKISSFRYTVNKILWPYLIFSICATFTDALLTYIDSDSFYYSCKMVLLDAYKTVILYGIHALWYLGSYIIAVWVYLKLKDFPLKVRASFEIGFIIAGISYSNVSQMYKMSTAISLLLVSLIRALVCSVFLFAGFDFYRILKKGSQKIQPIFVGFTFLLISLLFAELNGESNFSIIDYGGNSLLCLAASFCGAIGLCLLFKNHSVPGLIYLGRNSLILLVTHSSLKITVLSQLLVGRYLNNEKSWLYGIACLAIMLGIEMPIILLLNGKLNFLIRRPKCFKLQRRTIQEK
ncbi:acyltransferase family protein [Bilifractor sp. LCP21S3_A5]